MLPPDLCTIPDFAPEEEPADESDEFVADVGPFDDVLAAQSDAEPEPDDNESDDERDEADDDESDDDGDKSDDELDDWRRPARRTPPACSPQWLLRRA